MPLNSLTSWIERYVLLLVLVATLGSTHPLQGVSYHLCYDQHEPDLVTVRIDLPEMESGPLIFVMPRAIPMGYAEVQYDRFIRGLKAFSGSGESVVVQRGEGSRWRLGEAGSTIRRVEYTVNVRRMEREVLSAADASKIRMDYLGLLGYSVFGYIDGLEDRGITLSVSAPAGWPVFSTLRPQSPPDRGTTQASAANFYGLADSQVVAGPAANIRSLSGRGHPFFALYSESDADVDQLGNLIEETMDQVVDYFASVPFEHYTVHYEFLKPVSDRHEYGFSMEHMDSCTIFLDSSRAPTPGLSDWDRLRTRYNLAHHFAHSWIPKRSYGEGYFPFTWEHAPVIDTIWLSEGFVQYAAIEMITDDLPADQRRRIRERLIDGRFRKSLSEAPDFINRLSLIELSRAASTKYSEDFRYGRTVFSRGALMALELDQRIREVSGGSKRFRDVLRFLMAWGERERRPFKVAELPDLVRRATGVEVRGLMDRWMEPPNK